MAVTVGLDIGGNAVRVAVVDTGKSTRVVRRYAEMPLPGGAVNGGEIVDEGAVSEAVAALWKRHKLPRKRVIIGTANQRLAVRQVDVPQMGPDELAEALPFQVQDSIPISIDDAVLDFVPLEQFVTPEGEPMESILAIAVHRDIVDSILRVMDTAKVAPAAVDLQAFALVRSIFGLESGVGNPLQAIVDIGASITQVVIARAGTAHFVRLLPRGGDDFTAALRDGLDLDGESADELKRTVGVEPIGLPEGDDEVSQARRVLTEQADSLIDEVRGSVNYFETSSGDQRVERLVVAGNAARLPHLANRFGRSLSVDVEPARVLDLVEIGNIEMSDDEVLDAQPVIPTAVGLALWGDVP
jgi:type IV pilus assembly protein PilM